jgi:hypothetical protein
MLLVILPGHIDLSAGSGVGLTGGLAAVGATQQLGIGAWAIAPLNWLRGWAEQLGEWSKAQWPTGCRFITRPGSDCDGEILHRALHY